MTRRAGAGGPAWLTAIVLCASVGWTRGAPAYEVVPVADGGSLHGVVRFTGTPPRLDPLPVNKNRDVCGDIKESEALVIGADRGVRGSVVMIEKVTRGKKPDHEALVDNRRCQFAPHVSAVMAGSRVQVKNSDPVLHNTHGVHVIRGAAGTSVVFNLALPNKDQTIDITKRLWKPGAIHVLCDAHPHMSAWLYVHGSPYVAVTDGAGRYRIDGIPPGTYTVTMWHEGFIPRGRDKDGRPVYDEPRSIRRDVRIAPAGSPTLDFDFK